MTDKPYKFIRVTTMIENWLGKKIHYSHCIPIEDGEELQKGMRDLIEWCTKHCPMFLSAEIIQIGERQTKPKE